GPPPLSRPHPSAHRCERSTGRCAHRATSHPAPRTPTGAGNAGGQWSQWKQSMNGVTMTIQVAILAAGMGTRLGRPWPKPLTKLDDGRSIMGQQRDNIAAVFGQQARVMTVVGFKLESILEAFPDGLFVYNENFDTTNTSKSLLKALRFSGEGPVLWMNGDVVFDPQVLARLESSILRGDNVICVNTSAVAEEEVKYTVAARKSVV